MTTAAMSERESEARARLGITLRAKWHLDALLGIGGMAAVYAATHRNGQRGAVKIMHHDARDPDARRRFLREGQIANRVEHDGVVSVLDDDVAADGSPFLVMELLDGEPLSARAARTHDRLSSEDVLAFVAQVLDALAAAHDKGIIHRDIKPENLFVTTDARVKILDFGIAHLDEAIADELRTTHVGTAMGTPAFMAPEQAAGRWDLVGPESDLWSLGATMFTLLTGHFVHDAPSMRALLVATMSEPACSLAIAMPGAPKPLVDIVDCALQMKIADRWHDAREMQVAVRAAYRSITGEELPQLAERRSSHPPSPVSGTRSIAATAPIAPRPRPRRRGVFALAGLAAALGACALVAVRALPSAYGMAKTLDTRALSAAPTAMTSPSALPPPDVGPRAIAETRATLGAEPSARPKTRTAATGRATTVGSRPTPPAATPPASAATLPEPKPTSIFDRRL